MYHKCKLLCSKVSINVVSIYFYIVILVAIYHQCNPCILTGINPSPMYFLSCSPNVNVTSMLFLVSKTNINVTLISVLGSKLDINLFSM